MGLLNSVARLLQNQKPQCGTSKPQCIGSGSSKAELHWSHHASSLQHTFFPPSAQPLFPLPWNSSPLICLCCLVVWVTAELQNISTPLVLAKVAATQNQHWGLQMCFMACLQHPPLAEHWRNEYRIWFLMNVNVKSLSTLAMLVAAFQSLLSQFFVWRLNAFLCGFQCKCFKNTPRSILGQHYNQLLVQQNRSSYGSMVAFCQRIYLFDSGKEGSNRFFLKKTITFTSKHLMLLSHFITN